MPLQYGFKNLNLMWQLWKILPVGAAFVAYHLQNLCFGLFDVVADCLPNKQKKCAIWVAHRYKKPVCFNEPILTR